MTQRRRVNEYVGSRKLTEAAIAAHDGTDKGGIAMKGKHWAIAALVVLVSAAVGYFFLRPATEEPPAVAALALPPPVPAPTAPNWKLSLNTIKIILKNLRLPVSLLKTCLPTVHIRATKYTNIIR